MSSEPLFFLARHSIRFWSKDKRDTLHMSIYVLAHAIDCHCQALPLRLQPDLQRAPSGTTAGLSRSAQPHGLFGSLSAAAPQGCLCNPKAQTLLRFVLIAAHGYFQGRGDPIELHMPAGINFIPWVQSNVNGTIITHMLLLMSPIKPEGYVVSHRPQQMCG